MAVDVTSLLRIMNRFNDDSVVETKGDDLVTMDLLGGSKEVELDLKPSDDCNKRHDHTSSNELFRPTNDKSKPVHHHLQDLNFPPLFSVFPSPSPPNLYLGLFPPSSAIILSENRSVCTLDKVKLALERARMSSNPGCRSRELPNFELDNSLSPSSSGTNANSKEEGESRSSVEEENSLAGPMLAAGCPECLSYVLVSRENPMCPRCCAVVPSPAPKKRRIAFDLNLSFS